ncbi:hypothetical protein PLCT1_00290 [Planctomycetaceae bacterium]|nr:hypothetical protein PLCT1_00290 [Planctomycetaceae bacterium]
MPAGYSSFCDGTDSIVTYYQAPNGEQYVIRVVCATCTPTTPQPPSGTITPPTQWPCETPPALGGSQINQSCTTQWPGWDLSVSVKIPPVNMARNPWTRSLVALDTKFCFVSALDSEEKFSESKAKPCNASGESDEGTWQCGGETGEVSEGDRVNYQLGVAWRRFTGTDPGFGTQPPFQSALNLEDREWNGGSQIMPLLPGQCTSHTYQTSSYGLPEIGETWNTECQERECDYVERAAEVNRGCEACDYCWCEGCTEAYQAFIQTWWWPEWTFSYDEYVCVHQEPDDCFQDAAPGGRGCTHGPHAGEAGWKETVSCDRWGWQHTVEPWRLYDVRKQGLPLPFIGSGRTAAAGMTPEHQVMTPFQYSPAVPVIEIQPVGVP